VQDFAVVAFVTLRSCANVATVAASRPRSRFARSCADQRRKSALTGRRFSLCYPAGRLRLAASRGPAPRASLPRGCHGLPAAVRSRKRPTVPEGAV